MSPALLMGIDLGTSSTKTVIIDQDGHVLSCTSQEYSFNTPRPGWAEQDPKVWLEAALATMHRAIFQADVSPKRIAAIGLSGQMHGTVCLDEQGQALRPAVIWADQRSREQVGRVYRDLGEPTPRKRWLVASLWKHLAQALSEFGQDALDRKPNGFGIPAEALGSRFSS